jgi:hypothetical protein
MVKRIVKNQNDNLILKPRKQMLNNLQIDHIIQHWKGIFKGYTFVLKSSSLETCMQELWTHKVIGRITSQNQKISKFSPNNVVSIKFLRIDFLTKFFGHNHKHSSKRHIYMQIDYKLIVNIDMYYSCRYLLMQY